MAFWEAQTELLRLTCAGGPTQQHGSAPPIALDALRSLLHEGPASGAIAKYKSLEGLYHSVQQAVEERWREALAAFSADEQDSRLLALLQAGVSCLDVFVRHNVSGPWLPPPPSPLSQLAPDHQNIPCTPNDTHTADAATTQQPATASPADAAQGSVATPGLGFDNRHPHERWAANQLAFDGEDVLVSCSGLQWLWLADIILVQPLLGAPRGAGAAAEGADANTRPAAAAGGALARWPTWSWWALRVVLMEQQVLEGRSAQLWSRVETLTAHLIQGWAAPAIKQLVVTDTPVESTAIKCSTQVPSHPGAAPECVRGLATAPTTLACLLMELALAHYAYGYTDNGKRLLADTGNVLGLEVELTGALGKRTVHQTSATAQLVVRAGRTRRAAPAASHDIDVTSLVLGVGTPATAPTTAPATAHMTGNSDSGDSKAQMQASEGAQANSVSQATQETAGLSLDEDVYLAPQLVDAQGHELESSYSGVEQALLLSWAKHVRTATAQDELQLWQMAPYVEAVLTQTRSQPMLQAQAHLLKIRHESGRNRTRERALLHMEQLVEVLRGTGAQDTNTQQWGHTVSTPEDASQWHEAVHRFPYVFCSGVPLSSRIRKDLAHQYLALGFVSAAVKLLEALEAWDALIVCYRLMDKKHLAEELIRNRLKVTPDDPSLWCGLGDLHLDDTYYETAWERSKHRHARSKRSLGHSALRRKDYAAAAAHLEQALSLNPLNPDAWFALGYAYLKLPHNQHNALKAFTHVTQQQPDHAEAWNNLAALFADLGKDREAFSALSQCVKHKRDSWQVWENFASVAVKAGAYTQAVNALRQSLQLTHGQRLPLETVKSLLDVLEHPHTDATDISAAEATQPQPGLQGNGHHEPNTETDSAVAHNGCDNVGEGEGEDDLTLPVEELSSFAEAFARSAHGDSGDSNGLSTEGKGFNFQRDLEAANKRSMQQLSVSLGSLLKEAVNLPCCTPGLWGCLGRYYRLTGHPESAKEAMLKQVRALAGTSYGSDEQRFSEMAEASIQLAESYVQLYEDSLARSGAEGKGTGRPAVRELAAARMHLRGVLKQCEGSFGSHALWQRMDELLKKVTEMENQAIAADKK